MYVYMDINKPDGNKNASCKHISWNISFQKRGVDYDVMVLSVHGHTGFCSINGVKSRREAEWRNDSLIRKHDALVTR